MTNRRGHRARSERRDGPGPRTRPAENTRARTASRITGRGCQHCGQTIAYVLMVDTGKRLPVDPIPVADGNVCARRNGRRLEGYVVTEARPANPAPGFRRYAVHFATCPDRPRPGQARKPKPEPPATLPGLES